MAITPRHYLDFINHYANLFHEKRSELEEQQMHLNVGLRKIKETVDQVQHGASGPHWEGAALTGRKRPSLGGSGPHWEGAARVYRRAMHVSLALTWLLLLRWKSCVGTSG